MRFSGLLAGAAAIAAASAYHTGFNYASTNEDGSDRTQAQFEQQFTAAKDLAGTNSKFTSARLYTMIQAGTTDTPIEAIEAAISTGTTLLLGMWCSAGQSDFDNELAALKSAISTYGTDFTDLVAGLSVGSEDLYRITPTGIENDAGVGAGPADIVSYIKQARAAIAGTDASAWKVGHVDTWTAWVNSSNDAVIDEADFIGMDAYPYFENTLSNGIANAKALWKSAYSQTKDAADGKPVWITETGWPVSGATENDAVASTANARKYWVDVYCAVKGKANLYWYILEDEGASPSFGVTGSDLSTTPLYSLDC